MWVQSATSEVPAHNLDEARRSGRSKKQGAGGLPAWMLFRGRFSARSRQTPRAVYLFLFSFLLTVASLATARLGTLERHTGRSQGDESAPALDNCRRRTEFR